jgi:hypothetical protein
MQCPTNKTAGVPPASKVIFSALYTFFCQPPVGPHARILNCALKRLKLKREYFGSLASKYTIKMKRKVRRIHWYTDEKEKTNDTKVIKDQTYCIFYN